MAPQKRITRTEPLPLFKPLYEPHRYKLLKGGRGSMKSWQVAEMLIWRAYEGQIRWLCTREYQSSIKDSVHKLLKDTIMRLGLVDKFYITDNTIRGIEHGSEFIFKGLRMNYEEIKSTEGLDGAWVEEAENTSEESLKVLRPTIRKEGSELIFSWNPCDEGTPIDKLAKNLPRNAILITANWRDNPYLTQELENERLDCLDNDPDSYEWIWEGAYRKITASSVFGRKVVVEEFETPIDARFFYGADWGFAADPTVCLRQFIKDETLYIDYEAYGYGVEIDELPQLFDSVPNSRDWPIKADGSRPETISYMKRAGFNIIAAKKWQGSVEDGIAYLKGFKRIVIHPRCTNMVKESKLYSYKVDKVSGDILPILLDKDNHGWDACRYSLDGYITNKKSAAPSIRRL